MQEPFRNFVTMQNRLGVTVQIPLELLWHTAIWNRFAMGRMPATATYSYGQRGERADLSELLRLGNSSDSPAHPLP